MPQTPQISLPSDPTSHKLRLTVAAVAAGGLLAVLVVLAYGMQRVSQISGLVHTNQQINTAALCALRADLQQRVRSGERFLQRHPHGLLGIPAPTIRASLNNQQHTIDALALVRCSTEP